MQLEVGQTARLVQPVIEGPVLDTQYNKDAKELEHLIEWIDGDGETQSRWFLSSQLEGVA